MAFRSFLVDGIRIIVRNQQRYVGGNGIFARRQCAVVEKNNGFGATVCCGSTRRIQIEILIRCSAHTKQRCIRRYEYRVHGCGFGEHQGCTRGIRQIFSGGLIIPAEELIAACRCCNHGIGFRCALGKLRSCCNGGSINGIRAAISRLKRSRYITGSRTF